MYSYTLDGIPIRIISVKYKTFLAVPGVPVAQKLSTGPAYIAVLGSTPL